MQLPVSKPSAFVLASVAIFFIHPSSALSSEDRTIEEFKRYASERLQGRFTEEQLETFAKLVDADGDGVISDEEFSRRMEALSKVDAEEDAPASKPEESAPEPVVIAPLTSTGEARLLLITHDSLAEAWLPFAVWKTQNGKDTKIVTVRQIATSYEGPTIQEKIRRCVREHIDKHETQWVLLGGDCLPGGDGLDSEGLVPGGHRTVHAMEPQGIPTDIVYISPTDWDADGDEIYGEWEDDQDAITYPDGSIGLGRVPVRTAKDVSAFTEKIISYESNYPTREFAQNMIYTCTDTPAYPKVRRSWDEHLSNAWDGGTMGRFFSQETPWDDGDPGSFPLSAENLVDLINAKNTGKFHIHGHGLLPQWILENSIFTTKHASQLSNENAYPLITTVSCNTGEYDSNQDPSIVESLIRQPKGGSVAVVAPIRTGKPHFHDRRDFRLMVSEGKLDGTTLTMTRYWTNGLGEGLTTGEALMAAKGAMEEHARQTAGYHLCVCELNLLGDPTLDMRAENPRDAEVQLEGDLTLGHHRIEITTNVPGATVCLWKGLELYVQGETDKEGRASFDIEIETPGTLRVGVNGPGINAQTFERTVQESN